MIRILLQFIILGSIFSCKNESNKNISNDNELLFITFINQSNPLRIKYIDLDSTFELLKPVKDSIRNDSLEADFKMHSIVDGIAHGNNYRILEIVFDSGNKYFVPLNDSYLNETFWGISQNYYDDTIIMNKLLTDDYLKTRAEFFSNFDQNINYILQKEQLFNDIKINIGIRKTNVKRFLEFIILNFLIYPELKYANTFFPKKTKKEATASIISNSKFTYKDSLLIFKNVQESREFKQFNKQITKQIIQNTQSIINDLRLNENFSLIFKSKYNMWYFLNIEDGSHNKIKISFKPINTELIGIFII